MLEAFLTSEKGYFDSPIQIDIRASCDPLARAQLEKRLKADKILKAGQLKLTRKENESAREEKCREGYGLQQDGTTVGMPTGTGEDGSEQPTISLQGLVQASENVSLRGRDADMLKGLAMDEVTLSQMPMASQPATLRAQLLPYQLQGLAWMTGKENPRFPDSGSGDTIQLWRRDAWSIFANVASNFVMTTPPPLLSGGILADDMGLGKTLQVISLIMTGGPGATLIVAPVSVMSNWEQQIRRHVLDEHRPRLLIYHGPARQSDLSAFDVVITSYGTLTSEANPSNPSKGPLAGVEWRRVVLDEGHIIRNAKTRAALSACSLKAQARWVLTGTPMCVSCSCYLGLQP